MTAQTEAVQAPAPEFGQARLRKEDERLITGQTNWTDNIRLPGMLHVAFLRSPFALALPRMPWRAREASRGALRAAANRADEGTRPPLTCTGPPTTGGIWPAC